MPYDIYMAFWDISAENIFHVHMVWEGWSGDKTLPEAQRTQNIDYVSYILSFLKDHDDFIQPKKFQNLEVPGLARCCPNKCWTRNVVVRFLGKGSRKKGAKCNVG